MLMNDVNIVDGTNNSLDYGEEATFYATFQNVGQDPSDELIFTLTPGPMDEEIDIFSKNCPLTDGGLDFKREL